MMRQKSWPLGGGSAEAVADAEEEEGEEKDGDDAVGLSVVDGGSEKMDGVDETESVSGEDVRDAVERLILIDVSEFVEDDAVIVADTSDVDEIGGEDTGSDALEVLVLVGGLVSLVLIFSGSVVDDDVEAITKLSDVVETVVEVDEDGLEIVMESDADELVFFSTMLSVLVVIDSEGINVEEPFDDGSTDADWEMALEDVGGESEDSVGPIYV